MNPRMYFSTALSLLILSIGGLRPVQAEEATKTTVTASRTVEDGGTGPFKAVMTSDSTLEGFTVFRPADLSAIGEDNKLPIIAWGNGGCANSPGEHLNFLSEVASQGFLLVAIGPMPQEGARGGGGGGMGGGGAASEKPQLIQAIDWAIAQNSDPDSIYFGKIDTSKVAVSGMSCGGLQALQAASDPRVTTAMICNSGIFNSSGGGRGGGGGMGGMPALTKDDLKKLHGSIIYILGGESDMAYANGMDDFEKIEDLPAFTANLDVGHGGTYMRPHGGEFAIVASAWLKWQLKGDEEAAKMFQGDPCGVAQMEGWKVQKKNIDKPAATSTTRTVEDGGTGAYKAVMASNSSLPAYTLFRPEDLSAFGEDKKLPIIAWGNGGCANSPSGHLNFLSEVASHGFLLIAIGPMPQEGAGGARGGGMPPGGMGGAMPPGGMGGAMPPGGRGGAMPPGGGAGGARGAGMRGGMPPGGASPATSDVASEKSQLIAAIDWAIAQNSDPDSIYYNKIDTTKIAVSGMSCGGLQALEAAPDPRVTTAMICNSGIINSSGGGGGGGGMGGMPALTKDDLKKLHGSIIYILGGDSDIAYANGMDDFEKIEDLPAFTANLDVGHGGTYMRPHGGEFAVVATAWLQWQLQGDEKAAKMFKGDPCGLARMEGWKIQKKNID